MNSSDDWTIRFQKNVHMYCHRLTVAKGDKRYEIQCEDTPAGFVGIWLHELDLDEKSLGELAMRLYDWAQSSGFLFRIYPTKETWIANIEVT